MMLLIDTLIAPHNTHSHGKQDVQHDEREHDEHAEEGHSNGHNHAHAPRRMRSYTPLRPISTINTSPSKAISKTAGLTIHSICDGVALGAATYGDNGGGLSLVVFLAIAVHKAPASLGLSSSLLNLVPQLSRTFYRLCIVIFSLSTPFSAFATYTALHLLNLGTALGSIPGYALLFSGGTFLFVATQATSEQLECSTDRKGFLSMYLIGIFAPVLVSVFFKHSH